MKKSRILSLVLALMLLVSVPVSAVGVVAKTGATKVLVEDRQIAAQSYEIEGFNLYQELFDLGVNLVFLKDQHINTDVYRKALSIEIPKSNSSTSNTI